MYVIRVFDIIVAAALFSVNFPICFACYCIRPEHNLTLQVIVNMSARQPHLSLLSVLFHGDEIYLCSQKTLVSSSTLDSRQSIQKDVFNEERLQSRSTRLSTTVVIHCHVDGWRRDNT